jgi:cytochrome c oxidase accessory protein FixG
MEKETLPLVSPDQVLSTLNPDGTRRWLAPRLAKGRYWKKRRVVAYVLMLLFNVLPWIKVGGKPVMLLDLVHREFTFFGVTFQPTETVIVTALFLSIFIGIFLATALWGRVWCGWACPQTVYLEFLYRPIERVTEGRFHSKGRAGVPFPRKVLKYSVFAVVSLHLSHTFLAYFVGAGEVLSWSTGSPGSHPVGFAIVWGVALLMMFDFSLFREQMCTLACPYGRLQSALVDPNSVIIGYDVERGEPRGKGKRGTEKTKDLGDCIECKLCVAVCPTGIDIRDGLQMECIACAECIDACDDVMDKIGKERGLIRYASEVELAGGKAKLLRPRTILYTALFVALLGIFVSLLGSRELSNISILRTGGSPFTALPDGRVMNLFKVRLENRNKVDRTYTIDIVEPGFTTSPEALRVELGPSETEEFQFSVFGMFDQFKDGQADLHLRVSDGVDFESITVHPMVGPKNL